MTPTLRIAIDHGLVNRAKDVEVSGVLAKAMLSPFDVPHTMEVIVDDKNHRFIFHYFGDDETTNKIGAHEPMRCLVGKVSGRLYEMSIYLDQTGNQMTPEILLPLIKDTISKLLKSKRRGRSNSISAVAAVLDAYSSELAAICHPRLTNGRAISTE